MRSLSAQEILQVWERGYYHSPVERALILLAATCPDMTVDELAELSVGKRDAYLLTLREHTFGTRLNGFAVCPQCQERMEFNMNISDIRVANQSVEQVHEIYLNGFELRFRLLNSWDLAAVVKCNDAYAAHNLLVQRCLLKASQGGVVMSSNDLSKDVVSGLIAHIAKCDNQAEVLLSLECPECDHCWQLTFDIVSFFWSEINAQAKRLLNEVHTMAMAYGWREADILSMSATRRQFYLEMIN